MERQKAVDILRLLLGGMEEAQTEQVKLSPAIHLSFQAFEPIDLPFDLPLTPRQGARRRNGRVILLHALGETFEFGDLAAFGCSDPIFQFVRFAFFDHAQEVRDEELGKAYELIQDFRTMVTRCQLTFLPRWIDEAKASGLPELSRFAVGLYQDYEAVRAALSQEWSQGQTEGQVHRLKLIKRQGYGRAGFDLFRLRVLHGSGRPDHKSAYDPTTVIYTSLQRTEKLWENAR